jgi:signal transduction histidine kinase/ligand-binding sensor protein
MERCQRIRLKRVRSAQPQWPTPNPPDRDRFRVACCCLCRQEAARASRTPPIRHRPNKISCLVPEIFVVYSRQGFHPPMTESQPSAVPQKEHESVLFAQLFSDSEPNNRTFFDALFSSIFKAWGAFALVGFEEQGDCRILVNFSDNGPLCNLIEDLGLKGTCIDCVKRRAREVANNLNPITYWCDWGLIEIAVPILMHGVPVGVILCGQKRLLGEEDLEGQHKLETFAVAKGIDGQLPELRERRSLCPAISRTEASEMVRILSGASKFISHVLYSKLDETTKADQGVTEELEDLFEGFEELDGGDASSARFWNALEKPLDRLFTVFDSRCLAVVLETDRKLKLVASHGLEKDKLRLPLDGQLISSKVKNFEVPEHLWLNSPTTSICSLTSCVMREYPLVDLVVLDKAKLGANRLLHVLVYFDPTIPRKNRLLLHQKEKALSLFLRHAANSFLHAERVGQLERALKDQDALLQDVVHQINQPLHGILADSELLLNVEYPVERKTRILKYFPQRAKQLAMLVKCVQYSEKEGTLRSAKQEPSNVNLSKFLIESAMVFQGYAEDKDVRIEVDTAVSDTLGEVRIDRDHLAMALTNVLFNAVKYSFRGTTVTVRVEVQDEGLSILITDDGIQIKKTEREIIFDRRKRTDLAKRFMQSGLGIGLYVTRALMRNMGGDAAVVDSIPTSRLYKDFREHQTTMSLSLPKSVVSNQGGTK